MDMLRDLVQGNGLIVVIALILGALAVAGVILKRRAPPPPPGEFRFGRGGGGPLPEDHPQRQRDDAVRGKEEGPQAS